METSRSATGDVVSIGKHAAYRADFKSIASQRLRAAREKLGQDRTEFAALLTGLLGWNVAEAVLARWERGATPPGDVLLAAAAAEQGDLIAPRETLLGSVPHSFPADSLDGPWVTSYQFTHSGVQRYHADIAHVKAESGRQVRVANHPPEPRTEGRALPFRNEMEVRLFSRHLVGHWKNTSDARYFGSVHLAVLPGETVMDGYYTGFASDIGVSLGRWKWVRLDPSLPRAALSRVILREPSSIYEFVMNHSQDDAPATLADIGEDA